MTNSHYKKDCFYFSGLKPCFPHYVCQDCTSYKQVKEKILYIHTGAMGDIIRQMALLRLILETHPEAQVSVCTAKKAVPLFGAVKEDFKERLLFYPMDTTAPFYWDLVKFDVLYNLDRDLASSALATKVSAKRKFGFSLEDNGTLGYFNPEAAPVFELGLNDKKKFYENKLFADQYMAEAMGLTDVPSQFHHGYGFRLPTPDMARAQEMRQELHDKYQLVLGVNVGVGPTIPFKNLSERAITQVLLKAFESPRKKTKILLLGGEAEKRIVGNIKQRLDLEWEGRTDVKVEECPTTSMIEGAQVIYGLDLLLTSDTFALHLALSLGVPNLSWFGPTNAEEIRFSEKSTVVQSDFTCAPCWKNHCDLAQKCNDSDRLVDQLALKVVDIFTHA